MATTVVVGRSRVGVSLTRALRRAGLSVKNVPARARTYAVENAEVIVIAARDRDIASVAKKAVRQAGSELAILVHLSGSRSAQILPSRAGVARLTLHPIQTFSKPSADLFSGISWMASTDDRKALQWAKRTTRLLGAREVITLSPDMLPLYHAMTVFASNYLVLLGGVIEEIGSALDQNPASIKKAMEPLMQAALRNVMRSPSLEALTGPLARKDFETITSHQRALRSIDPKLRKLYDAFLGWAVSRGY